MVGYDDIGGLPCFTGLEIRAGLVVFAGFTRASGTIRGYAGPNHFFRFLSQMQRFKFTVPCVGFELRTHFEQGVALCGVRHAHGEAVLWG